MTFSPTILRLLRFLAFRPDGVSWEKLGQHLAGTPPEWVDRALEELLEAGVVERQGDKLVPLPRLKPLAERMGLLAHYLNERSQAIDLARMILRRRAR